MSVGPVLDSIQATINAWTGAEVPSGSFAGTRARWAAAKPDVTARRMLRPTPIDERNWLDPRVGWGLVLPERCCLPPAALATADDAPEPIRALVQARAGKVLRYRASTTYGAWTLRDYAGGGDVFTAAAPMGTGPQELPAYLLLYGTPAEIPWGLQYTLNPVRRVGRLDLTGDALANYVAALLSDWSDSAAHYDAPVVWSVDHGGGDITTMMRRTLAVPFLGRAATDPELGAVSDVSAANATGTALATALATATPALVITTSHGMTGPLNDLDAMRETLGMLVDADHRHVEPAHLLGSWEPSGAIWYAHACCSAGADSPSAYAGLFASGSSLADTLSAVAGLGAMTAPLPRALLGAARPLRAWIGQVEPTFDWTLAFPPNNQALTASLQDALYQRLCSGDPVGFAFEGWYSAIGSLLQQHGDAVKQSDRAVGVPAKTLLDLALYRRVTAYDRASTVILGDPTVCLPLP